MAERSLKDCFMEFCRFGDKSNDGTMTGSHLMKLVNDSKLTHKKKLTSTDVDLIFAGVKKKGTKTINYAEFKKALEKIAAKLYAKDASADAYTKVEEAIKSHHAKTHGATKADDVRLADEMVGIAARGGPSTSGDNPTLSDLANRKSSDARGIERKGAKSPRNGNGGGGGGSPQSSPTNKKRTPRARSRSRSKSSSSASGEVSSIKPVYLKFCKFGDKNNEGSMNATKFSKLCQDCGILHKKHLTKTDVEMIFASNEVKERGSKTIDYKQFKVALDALARKRFQSLPLDEARSKVDEMIMTHAPEEHGTHRAEKVKLHDDKSSYTGVYAKGGPSTSGDNPTLKDLANRRNSDARGVEVKENDAVSPRKRSASKGRKGSMGRRASFGNMDIAAQPTERPEPVTVKRAFQLYAMLGGHEDSNTIPNTSFYKLCKDCMLIDSQNVKKTDIDMVFLAKNKRRPLEYKQFKEVIEELALRRFPDKPPKIATEMVMTMIKETGGPQIKGTAADDVRLANEMVGVAARGGPSTSGDNPTLSDLADRSDADARGSKKKGK